LLVLYRLAGSGSQLRKYTIGPYGQITLPMVRAQAQKIFAARLDGRDPAEEKKQARRRLVVDRVDDLVEAFIREHVSGIRTGKKITNLLRRDVVAHWGAMSVDEIKKRDCHRSRRRSLATRCTHRPQAPKDAEDILSLVYRANGYRAVAKDRIWSTPARALRTERRTSCTSRSPAWAVIHNHRRV